MIVLLTSYSQYCFETIVTLNDIPRSEKHVDERGDAIRGTPSLDAWVFLEYYLGMPWESPSLGLSTPYSPHIDISPKT